VLTELGTTTPWSPHMSAWSADPLPADMLHRATPLVRQGAAVFQSKQCRNCHSIGGSGGQRGPALDDVATRMTMDQMRFKVVTGGGNMPAYGKNLSPPEIEALVNFLETLHPADEPPAYDPAQQAAAEQVNENAPSTDNNTRHVNSSMSRSPSNQHPGTPDTQR
jgi:ubiquinol-cytochrome c reductase cytochrome b subunit